MSALLGTALPQQLLPGILLGLGGTRLFWLCPSFESSPRKRALAEMLKDAGPAPGSAAEQPDEVVPLSEPPLTAASGDRTRSCSGL